MTAHTDRIDLALDKALAERSLHEFFRQSWPVTTPGAALCDGWHLEAIAEHLEAVVAGQIQDLLILVPPRCGKTLLTSICLAPWAWTRFPELQFLCASYGQRLSNRHSTDCRRLMQSRWYRARWGHRWKIVGDVNRMQPRFRTTTQAIASPLPLTACRKARAVISSCWTIRTWSRTWRATSSA